MMSGAIYQLSLAYPTVPTCTFSQMHISLNTVPRKPALLQHRTDVVMFNDLQEQKSPNYNLFFQE